VPAAINAGAVVDVRLTVGSGKARAAGARVPVDAIGATSLSTAVYAIAFVDVDLAVWPRETLLAAATAAAGGSAWVSVVLALLSVQASQALGGSPARLSSVPRIALTGKRVDPIHTGSLVAALLILALVHICAAGWANVARVALTRERVHTVGAGSNAIARGCVAIVDVGLAERPRIPQLAVALEAAHLIIAGAVP
jgi:hypothetical protein